MTVPLRKFLFAATALVALVLGTNAMFAQARSAEGRDAVSLAPPKYGSWGFDATGMDLTVKPGDDFFRYANGKWADRTEIPSDRARYGNFDALAELSENRLRAIPGSCGRLEQGCPERMPTRRNGSRKSNGPLAL